MAETIMLTPQSAFGGLLAPVGTSRSAGITVQELTGLQIATVIARNADFAAKVKSRYGIDLPSGPRRVLAGDIAFLGTGPRTWLVLREGGSNLCDELSRSFEGSAAVSEQSDGYAVLRLSGTKVRALFEKGLAVDLHPRAFGPGHVAVTTCAQIGVTIWQTDEAPTYGIALYRSYAGSYWHWLSESAAEFGLSVADDARG